MTLNLWAYNDWSNRKQNILNLIHDLRLDILTLQEVRIDAQYSSLPQSQELAEKCGYKYHAYSPAWSRSLVGEATKSNTSAMSHGLSIVSKFPITNVSTRFLTKHPDFDEPCIIMFADIDIDGDLYSVCNVHFANRDLYADLHLKELMSICSSSSRPTIIQGDYNIFHLEDYTSTLLQEYELSSEKAQYQSFSKDNATLDYIIVPSSTYQIDEVFCSNVYVSDHNAVMAKISKKAML